MQIHQTIDVTAYHRVAPAQVRGVPVSGDRQTGYQPGVEQNSYPGMSTKNNVLDYNLAVEPARELTPVNVHPKHRAAIDTILTIAHYDGGETIINTYA